MKPHPWKCGTCRERAVVPVRVPRYEVTLEHDGRKYPIVILNLDAYGCEKCGALMLPDEADERLSNELRNAAGLLTPAEIRGHRESLGLFQKQLADHLQISDSTLSRWETGVQIQQRSLDRMLRAYFLLPEFRRFCVTMSSMIPGVSVQSPGEQVVFQDMGDWTFPTDARFVQSVPQTAPLPVGMHKPSYRMAG